jgi:RNA polymerase sigma-70 factor (sigma-E family)
LMRMERSEGIAVMGSASSRRLAELYERHVGRAVALAALVGGDADAAEDIAHEAFIRTAGRLAGLRDPSAFDAYLRRTVVNLCRARARRALIERRYARWLAPRDNETDLSHTEDRDVLWRALRELPHRQRGAVVLRYYEDLSEEQVADAMRCSPRAVNALVSRAMAALRERIREEERT